MAIAEIVNLILKILAIVIILAIIASMIEALYTGEFLNPFGPGGILVSLMDAVTSLPCTIMEATANLVIQMIFALLSLLASVICGLINVDPPAMATPDTIQICQ